MNEGTLVKGRDDERPRPVRLGDIAVLARSNTAVKAIAAVLTDRKIAAATKQPGLLSRPEIVLGWRACGGSTMSATRSRPRRSCRWRSARIRILVERSPRVARQRRQPVGLAGHGRRCGLSDFCAIAGLRAQRAGTIAARSSGALIARCGLARRVLQWQHSAEPARRRLANLERLTELASEYEDAAGQTARPRPCRDCCCGSRSLAATSTTVMPQDRR